MPGRAGPLLSWAGALTGFAWFIWLGGAYGLDPTNFKWIIGDHAQHLLGWLFFRNDPWAWPIGTIESLAYPAGTSVAFTDANPWFAVFFKLIGAWLPPDFQFIGLWLALSFTLQGSFGARIMATLTTNAPAQLAGAALFVLAPPLVTRLGHDTLTAHWMLLALIWLNLREDRRARRKLGWAAAIAVAAAGVHPYLAAMVIGLTAALIARMVLRRELTPAIGLIAGTVIVVLTGAVMFAFGYVGTGTTLAGGGFGTFAADLLALVNPFEYSRWVPGVPGLGSSHEGFGYLGAGGLALAVAAVAIAMRSPGRWRIERPLVPLVVSGLLMYLFAQATPVTLAGYEIMTARGFYEAIEPIVAPLRATGRFVWPLHYVLLTGVLAVLVRQIPVRPILVGLLLTAGVVVQATERRPHELFQAHDWIRMPLSGAWDRVGVSYRHLVLYPAYMPIGPAECGRSPLGWAHVSRLTYVAYRQGMTMNSAYVARARMEDLAESCTALAADIEAGRLDPYTVYVATSETLPVFRRAGATCGLLDGFAVCVSGVIRGPFFEAVERGARRLP
jgi:hypothetical protein